MTFLVIVPFLDEERYLAAMLESLAAQTRPPDRVVLVDDGSTDRSPQIAHGFAERHAYATVLQRPPRPRERDRLARANELLAFEWGRAAIGGEHDVVVKLDADILLTPRTLEALERAFRADPLLGMAGPYLSVAGPDAGTTRQRCPSSHVEGPMKAYRSRCLEDISPLPPILGWDTIDEIAARVRGWRTTSVAVPGGDPIHLRPMGSHDGLLRAYRRWGTCAWGYGEHPLHVLLVAVQRLRDRPAVLGSVNYVVGWALAGARGAPRADPGLRAEVRRDQLQRIARRIRRLGRGTASAGPWSR